MKKSTRLTKKWDCSLVKGLDFFLTGYGNHLKTKNAKTKIKRKN